MAEEQDIDGLLACVDAGECVALEVAKVAKDGIQIMDGPALIAHLASSPTAQAKLFAAYSKAREVSAEVKNLDLKEKRVLTHRCVDFGYNVAEVFAS